MFSFYLFTEGADHAIIPTGLTPATANGCWSSAPQLFKILRHYCSLLNIKIPSTWCILPTSMSESVYAPRKTSYRKYGEPEIHQSFVSV
jgi:hypothetical protein